MVGTASEIECSEAAVTMVLYTTLDCSLSLSLSLISVWLLTERKATATCIDD